MIQAQNQAISKSKSLDLGDPHYDPASSSPHPNSLIEKSLQIDLIHFLVIHVTPSAFR
jgi:hypothetical protein